MSALTTGPEGTLAPDHPAAALVRALLAREQPERALKAHGIPAAAATGFGVELDPGAVEQGRDKARRLTRTGELAEAALAPLGNRLALPARGLGTLWSSDVDILIGRHDLPAAEQALRDAGFVDVNPLLERLGRVTPGVRRYAAFEGDEVLGSVELCLAVVDFGPSSEPFVARAEHMGDGIPRLTLEDTAIRRALKVTAARHATARQGLEFLHLAERGARLEDPVVRLALARCAQTERELTGEDGPVAALAGGAPAPRVTRQWVEARSRGVRREAVLRTRPRRLVVAFSGIDGSGKSTQAERLAEQLTRASIPVTVNWARLGFGGSKLLENAAGVAQKLLPRGSHSAQEARATGEAKPAEDSGGIPLTRRGPVGWSWTMAVTLDYLRRLRGPVRAARGEVVVLDRALPDALIGLDEGYGGALELKAHRRLLERFGPRGDVTFYLRLSGEASYARKRDLFALEVLTEHAARYDRALLDQPGVTVLDAERAPEQITLDALRHVLDG